jgi:hypothetical protein
MSHIETTTTSPGGTHYYDNSHSTSNGSGLFDNHGAGMPQDHHHKYATNDAHLGAATGRDGDTLSAGSTARNESTTRMMDGHPTLEKDFSRQDGGEQSMHVMDSTVS